jgi:hypothetical protein
MVQHDGLAGTPRATCRRRVRAGYSKRQPPLPAEHGDIPRRCLCGLHNAIPTPAKAKRWAKDFASTIALHAEELDRDEGRECLEFLFSHPTQTPLGTYPLGHWIAREAQGCHDQEARRQVATFDMRVCQKNPANREEGGLYIRNGAPAIDRIFVNTKWAGGAWKRALRKIEGVTAATPLWFRSGASRATRIPLDMLPAPLDEVAPT